VVGCGRVGGESNGICGGRRGTTVHCVYDTTTSLVRTAAVWLREGREGTALE
jgi:hypothetical protein